MNQLPPKDIPVGLLNGLKGLMDDNNLDDITELMKPLFKDFFPKWLSEIKEQMIFKTKATNNKKDEDKFLQIDAILNLLTSSLRNNEDNIGLMVDVGMHSEVAEIFLKTQSNSSRYLPLTECLTAIARVNRRAASDFIEQSVQHDLIQDSKLTFYQYKKIA